MKRELPSNVRPWKEIRAFARTNRMARLIELPKPTAETIDGFLTENVRLDEERMQLRGLFRGIDRVPQGNISLAVSRRDVNRIAEIFEFRVTEEGRTPYASNVYKSLINTDQLFRSAGGQVSLAFQDRMVRLKAMLGLPSY